MSAGARAALRAVEFLAPLDDAALGELVADARERRFAAGERVVGELEAGADVYVVVAGRAEVVVEPRGGERRVLATLEAGGAFGEMASLTGELRSASVVAREPLTVLVLRDADFDRLRERRPEVARVLAAMLARRLGEVDRSIDELLAAPAVEAPPAPASGRGALRRLWRELVVKRHRDLAFLTLAAFVTTLIGVRLVVYLAFRIDLAPRGVLRAAYMTGFGLVFVSAAAAVLTFRPLARRVIAVAYGVGAALILNELGVTLAFDIFYKDIHTPDPTVAFDVEQLYRRAEPMRAITIGLAVLIQMAYLRPFYRRAWFILTTRARRGLARWRG